MNNYLSLAQLGRNNWWRYFLAVCVILFCWQIVGSGPTFLLILWTMVDGDPATLVNQDASFAGIPQTVSFIAFMLASCTFMLGLFLAIRFVHGRRFLTLVTPEKQLDWARFFQGFFVWFVLAALVAILEALLYPGRYAWTMNVRSFIPFALFALLLIPIQTSAEELFFRGYILQGFGLKIKNIWILSVISGLIFMLPHFLNPEAKLNYFLMGIYYFTIGAAMAYATLKDDRLELALGLHAANNLFTALFANPVVTVLPSPSMFTVMEMDVVYSVVSSLIIIVIFLYLFTGPLKRKSSFPELVEGAIEP